MIVTIHKIRRFTLNRQRKIMKYGLSNFGFEQKSSKTKVYFFALFYLLKRISHVQTKEAVYPELFFFYLIHVYDSPAEQIRNDIEIAATPSSTFQGSTDLHRFN